MTTSGSTPPPVGGTAGAKAALRGRMRAERAALTTADRRRRAELVWTTLCALESCVGAATVLGYCAFGTEVPTDGLFERVWARGQELWLPRVAGDGLEVVGYRRGEPLVRSSLGVPEPVGSPLTIDREGRPVQPDLVIVPGLAFDPHGWRLGYGAGYYDRFLSTLPEPIHRLGVCFDAQVIDAVPHEESDRPVDAVITESRVLVADPGRGETGADPIGPGQDRSRG